MADFTPDSGSEPTEETPRSEAPPSSSANFSHVPVMADEIVALVSPVPDGTYLDATVGGAGHAEAVLEAHAGLFLIGIDQDADAIAAAAARLAPLGNRFRLHRARFDQLADVLAGVDNADGVTEGLSGFLFDLGVSSPQLDRADRGFSFRNDGPLDMRMDRDATLTADDVVNTYDESDLARLIRRYADERFSSRIAKAIVAARPINSTTRLAQIVADAIPAPARRRGGHPARRTFQAIRIEVNDELGVLERTLETALDALMPGGRGLVLTYHSGEDRIVKNAFRQRTETNVPPGLPVEQPRPDFSIVRPMARKPGEAEMAANPRATSARLRAIERVAA